MTEKVKKDLLEELENSTFEEILDLLVCYFNSPEERKFVKDYLLKNFEKKKNK
jgi:hypothetical protein